MTDETKTPEDIQNGTPPSEEVQLETHEEVPVEETPKDDPPAVVGEPEQPAAPQDPTLLGALTPQENAMLMNLRRQAQQITMELGNMDLQMDEMRAQIRAAQNQSQSILMQVGQRLGIPKDVTWTVGGDGNARVVPPQMLQAMQMQRGMMPRPQPAATVSQPGKAKGE